MIQPKAERHTIRIQSSDYHRRPRMNDGQIEFELGTVGAFNALFVQGWVTEVSGNKVIATVIGEQVWTTK